MAPITRANRRGVPLTSNVKPKTITPKPTTPSVAAPPPIYKNVTYGGTSNNIKPVNNNVTPITQNPAEVVQNAITPTAPITPITTATAPTYTPTSAVSNAPQYNQMYEAQKQSAIARIKDAIAGQVAGQQDIISQAPQRFQPLKNQASFQGEMNQRRVAEQMANMGLAGSGENITAGVRARTGTQQAIGDIGRQQEDVVTQAQRAIQGLGREEAGSINEIQNAIEADRIRTLIDEANRVGDVEAQNALRQYQFGREDYRTGVEDTRYADEIARQAQQRKDELARAEQQRKDAIAYQTAQEQGFTDPYGGRRLTADEQAIVAPYSADYAAALQDPNLDPVTKALIEKARYEKVLGSPDLREQYGRQYMTPQAIAQQEQDYAQSIAGNVIPDYQAEINKIMGDNDPTNDWKAPLLQAERQRKVAGIQESEQAQQEAMTKQAFDVMDALGYVPEQYAEFIGVPAGTRTSDRAYKDAQTSLGYARIAESKRASEATEKRLREKETTEKPTQYKLNESDKSTLKNIIDTSTDTDGYVDIEKALFELQALEANGYNQDALDAIAVQLGIPIG